MNKINVFVIENSIVPSLLIKTLSTDPNLNVSHISGDCKAIVKEISDNNRDVIVLNTSQKQSLKILSVIKSNFANLPVITFRTSTSEDGKKTVEALTLGAHDFVTRAFDFRNLRATIENINNSLIPKIKKCYTLRRFGWIREKVNERVGSTA